MVFLVFLFYCYVESMFTVCRVPSPNKRLALSTDFITGGTKVSETCHETTHKQFVLQKLRLSEVYTPSAPLILLPFDVAAFCRRPRKHHDMLISDVLQERTGIRP